MRTLGDSIEGDEAEIWSCCAELHADVASFACLGFNERDVAIAGAGAR